MKELDISIDAHIPISIKDYFSRVNEFISAWKQGVWTVLRYSVNKR